MFLKNKFFKDFYNERYLNKKKGNLSRLNNFLQAEHKRIFNRLIFPLTNGNENTWSIIDIGSGKSSYLDGLPNIVKVDLSVETLKSCTDLCVVGSIDALPFKDSSFDLVTCCQVLEHTLEPIIVLDEISRITRIGGYLVLTVPNRYSLMKCRYHSLERKIDTSGHLYEFMESWLHIQLQMRGFKILKSEGACYDIFWLMASFERNNFPIFFFNILSRVPNKWICFIMEIEAKLKCRSLTGLSLEIVVEKIL